LSRLTRSLAVLPLAGALALPLVTPASAAPPDRFPTTVPLPTGSLPEGVADAPGDAVFAGARSDGSIYRADLSDGTGRVVVPGRDGYAAVGMQYDPSSDLLWVAGGGPRAGRGLGTVTAYDGTSYERVYERVVPNAGFLNDLVVTEDAVYVTDSFDASLVVVPLTAGRPAGAPTELPLRGEYVQPQGFGANGIRELTEDELVLVSGGVLYGVEKATGEADVLEVRGRQLSGGDGLVLDGSRLYVVNGYGGDEAAVLDLAADRESAQAKGLVTDKTLDRPTTGVLTEGALYLVNGRFETLAADPDAEVYLTRVKARR
jgi:hypothetical protein